MQGEEISKYTNGQVSCVLQSSIQGKDGIEDESVVFEGVNAGVVDLLLKLKVLKRTPQPNTNTHKSCITSTH